METEDTNKIAAILEYLHEVYSGAGDLNVGSDSKHSIAEFGQKMPFVGRSSLLESTKALYDKRKDCRHVLEHHSHPIGVLGGCSGLGKTRGLVEIGKSIEHWKSENQWHVTVLISYNNGNPPICDRSLFGLADSEGLAAVANKALALRILYFAFVHKLVPYVPFENFAREFPSSLLIGLTTKLAITTICSFCQSKSGLTDGVLFIGVDEINFLVDEWYDGISEQHGISFLKATMMALGSSLTSEAPCFVFNVVAGITVLPLERVFAESGYPVKKLPIGLLSPEDCEQLLSLMEENDPNSWRNWRVCRAFRTVLNDFSPLPRLGERFLAAVEDKIKLGEHLMNIDYEALYLGLNSTISLDSHILAHCGNSLISDVMLSSVVSREQFVKNDSASSEVKTIRFTYGDLEEQGMIVLQTTVEELCIVQLPYALFRNIITCMNKRNPLINILRTTCAIGHNSIDGFIMWQSFEDLFVRMEAVREMLLARTLEEDKSYNIYRFYCVPHRASGSHVAVDGLFDILLREECGVDTAGTQVPPSDSCIAKAGENIMKSAPGALYDSFTCRMSNSGVKVFCFGQQKYHQECSVSLNHIEAECQKLRQLMQNGANNDIQYILVIASTRVAGEVFGNIPDGCIVMSGKSLETFFGPAFSGRLHLLAELSRVNINTASIGELKTLPGVSDIFASVIIHKRQQQAFVNWDDVKNRIPKINHKTERFVEF